MDDVSAILAEQTAYYRARAEEYDEWWEHRGIYDRGAEVNGAWDAAVHALDDYVCGRVGGGDVLELAAGTGNLTRVLASRAERVTAVDANAETLAINAAKLTAGGLVDRVEFVAADVFTWTPPRRYDVVFFSFWLSHVPLTAAPSFWATVDAALKPGGVVVLADNLARWDPSAVGTGAAGTSQRTLNDGSRWTIVKRYWVPPRKLHDELAALGWTMDVGVIDSMFIVASGTRTADA